MTFSWNWQLEWGFMVCDLALEMEELDDLRLYDMKGAYSLKGERKV
jgi:hypothetical protein